MLNGYNFIETSSQNINEGEGPMRRVYFRGEGTSPNSSDYVNIDGSFTMPAMEYFTAGMEDRLPEVIQQRVTEFITQTEPEEDEA